MFTFHEKSACFACISPTMLSARGSAYLLVHKIEWCHSGIPHTDNIHVIKTQSGNYGCCGQLWVWHMICGQTCDGLYHFAFYLTYFRPMTGHSSRSRMKDVGILHIYCKYLLRGRGGLENGAMGRFNTLVTIPLYNKTGLSVNDTNKQLYLVKSCKSWYPAPIL